MKKICLVMAILLLCTGCAKSVTCKEKSSDNSYKIVITDDGKIKEIILTYLVKEKDEAQAKSTEKNLREQFNGAENFKDVRVKRNGKNVTLTANVHYSFFFNDDKKTIHDVKKYFEGVLDMKCYE